MLTFEESEAFTKLRYYVAMTKNKFVRIIEKIKSELRMAEHKR